MFLLLSLLLSLAPEPDIQVEFTNIKTAKGHLYVAVYDHPDAFLEQDRVRYKSIIPIEQTGPLKLSLGNLKAGNYAISCFHDLNDNGRLDTNWMGIPTEPYGFSNNARPAFRAPKWKEAAFNLTSSGRSISVRLEQW